jgi:hypothetical protein
VRRFFSTLAAVAFVVSLGTGTGVAAHKKVSATPASMASMGTCTTGETWVKGYTTKKGKVVKGYCRKSKGKGKTPG